MLWMFHAKPTRPEGISNTEWYTVRHAESVATREAMKAGVFKGCYKVAGKDEVIGLIEVESFDQMDQAIYSLPVWLQGLEGNVELTWTPLRPYENWGEQLDGIVAGLGTTYKA